MKWHKWRNFPTAIFQLHIVDIEGCSNQLLRQCVRWHKQYEIYMRAVIKEIQKDPFQYHPMTSQYHSKNSEGLAGCNLSPEAQSTSLWLDMTMTNFGAPQTLCWSSNWWWRRGDNFFLAPEAIAPIGSGTPPSKDVVTPPINHLRTSPTPILVIAASFGTAKSLMGSKSSPGCYQLWIDRTEALTFLAILAASANLPQSLEYSKSSLEFPQFGHLQISDF